MSRRHSDSSFLTESVSQWTVDESPVRATRYHESLNNPLGWKNDFGLSEEISLLPRHRYLQQEGSTNDCDSIFERSEESKSISEVPIKTLSRDRYLQQEGSTNDCDSIFEAKTTSLNQRYRNTFSRFCSGKLHTSSQPHHTASDFCRADRKRLKIGNLLAIPLRNLAPTRTHCTYKCSLHRIRLATFSNPMPERPAEMASYSCCPVFIFTDCASSPACSLTGFDSQRLETTQLFYG
jgi:hypothetical protein